nr:MAG TPA: hypothetical protein [Caudoviricetes sp.]
MRFLRLWVIINAVIYNKGMLFRMKYPKIQ